MMTIRKEIEEKLREIERNEKVRIIRAVESGSRAWGFASPDSDYDVRFIYVRQQADYLILNEKRDVIEWQLDETLDINGWDIKKHSARLIREMPFCLSGLCLQSFTERQRNGIPSGKF